MCRQSCVFVAVDFFFFFKQKTAYEMRISDWSSDVCSSDLADRARGEQEAERGPVAEHHGHVLLLAARGLEPGAAACRRLVGRAAELEIGRASCRERVCQSV